MATVKTAKKAKTSTAATTPRAVWKGSIQFGLVHVPVALIAATAEHPVDFDWLDKRSLDPVGYQRINKTTGEAIAAENVVKGIAVEPGRYVIVSEAEIEAAAPKPSKTIAIEAFVANNDIPFVYLARAYCMVPINQGAKVYALLHQTLQEAARVGLARLVMQGRQHLAAVVPADGGLVLSLLRWPSDVRPWQTLDMPAFDSVSTQVSTKASAKEMAMARELVDGMTHLWDPEHYGADPFKEKIQALVRRKVQRGLVQSVPLLALESNATAESAVDALPTTGASGNGSKKQEWVELHEQVQKIGFDLSDLLLRSLQAGRAVKPPAVKAAPTLPKKRAVRPVNTPGISTKKNQIHAQKHQHS